jgi:hypothetical protein
MVDVDTFLTTLHVMVDDFCQSRLQTESSILDPMSRSIPAMSSPSPTSPDGLASGANGTSTALCKRPPVRCFSCLALSFAIQLLCARQLRSHRGSSLALGEGVEGAEMSLRSPGQSSAMPIRDAKRRGEGWLAGFAYTSDGAIAWGMVRGLPSLLVTVNTTGVITGFGFCAASATDHSR